MSSVGGINEDEQVIGFVIEVARVVKPAGCNRQRSTAESGGEDDASHEQTLLSLVAASSSSTRLFVLLKSRLNVLNLMTYGSALHFTDQPTYCNHRPARRDPRLFPRYQTRATPNHFHFSFYQRCYRVSRVYKRALLYRYIRSANNTTIHST